MKKKLKTMIRMAKILGFRVEELRIIAPGKCYGLISPSGEPLLSGGTKKDIWKRAFEQRIINIKAE